MMVNKLATAQGGGSVLVTGANGLIGYEVVKLLQEQGTPVVAIDRAVDDVQALADAFAVEIGDTHKLYEIIHKYDVAGIVHCGAVSGPMLARDNPVRLFAVNVGGTIDIAECARLIAQQKGGCRVVFCSSLSAYGDNPAARVTEDAPLASTGCYGASKIAGEAILRAYAAEHDIDVVALRITWVYGPRRTTDCVVRTMIENALAGKPTRFPFGQDFRRQFVHVRDVARSIRLALQSHLTGWHVYNISGDIDPTLGEVAEEVRALFPEADIVLEPGPDPVDNKLGKLDIAAARRDLGFVPAVSLKEGIRTYADWLRARGAGTSAAVEPRTTSSDPAARLSRRAS
jgi:UDP-glucuronate 4-epimerase